jgi:hypothetical protein
MLAEDYPSTSSLDAVMSPRQRAGLLPAYGQYRRFQEESMCNSLEPEYPGLAMPEAKVIRPWASPIYVRYLPATTISEWEPHQYWRQCWTKDLSLPWIKTDPESNED